jgi:hypothetical protein
MMSIKHQTYVAVLLVGYGIGAIIVWAMAAIALVVGLGQDVFRRK